MNDQRIYQLVFAGVSTAEIFRIIATAPEIDFDLRPNSTEAMLKAGVSEDIIKAMAAREAGEPLPPLPRENSRTDNPLSTGPASSISTASATHVSVSVPGPGSDGPVKPIGDPKPHVSTSIPVIRKSNISSLAQVRRIYIDELPNNFDQYLRAEFFKQMPKRVTVVLNKAEADGIITGVDEHDRRILSTITGRYFGLHDNTTASISILDPSESILLWSNEAGDRSLMFPIMHRNGERKVASRIVSKLKKALKAE